MLEIGETWSVVDRQSERGEEEQEDGWDEGGCLSTSGDDKYYQQGVEGRQRERERGSMVTGGCDLEAQSSAFRWSSRFERFMMSHSALRSLATTERSSYHHFGLDLLGHQIQSIRDHPVESNHHNTYARH